MEALARPQEEVDRHAVPILEWPGLTRPVVRNQVWVASVLLHASVFWFLMLAPRVAMPSHGGAHRFRTGTVLVAPPVELTQTAPNRNKIGKEFSLENLVPHPLVQVPPAIPPMSRAQARPLRLPPSSAAAVLPEPPSVDTARSAPPAASALGSTNLPGPPPQIQTEEKPKLAFESPYGARSGPAKPRGLAPPPIAVPRSGVMEATREAMRGSHGGTVVGDVDLQGAPGIGGGYMQLPAPGKTASALEMISDPGGVDFKPYLIRVLAAVKRNWMMVYPESARLGRVGRVQIQFAIAHDGSVPKLVIAVPSGTDALDRAAVAGISASTPFPPLPADFHGNQVRLQFTFAYNMK